MKIQKKLFIVILIIFMITSIATLLSIETIFNHTIKQEIYENRIADQKMYEEKKKKQP